MLRFIKGTALVLLFVIMGCSTVNMDTYRLRRDFNRDRDNRDTQPYQK